MNWSDLQGQQIRDDLYNWDINETQTTTQEMEESIPAEATLEKQNLMFCLKKSLQILV